MVNIRNYNPNGLYNYPVSKKNVIEITKLKEGEKASIVSNTMFKTMFQNKDRIKYSAKLLSYIIDISYEELVKSIRLYKNDVDKEYNSDKTQTCDYVAKINGSYVNIEVNNNSSIETMERNIQYLNTMYAINIEEGSKYEYQQVIQINLNNFSFRGKEKEMEIYGIKNEEGEVLTKNITYIQIYIPKIREKWYNYGTNKLNEFERCILALAEPNIELAKEIIIGDEIMEKYVDESVDVCKEKNFGESYDKEWALKDEYIREGIEQGHNEATIEIAKSLLKNGMSVEDVSKNTKLSLDEIEKIKEEMLNLKDDIN